MKRFLDFAVNCLIIWAWGKIARMPQKPAAVIVNNVQTATGDLDTLRANLRPIVLDVIAREMARERNRSL